MSSYFKLRSDMSRGVDSADKKACTELVQYFCQDVTGLCSVNVYDDGFIYMSPVPSEQLRAKYPNALIQVPAGAVPCEAAEYDAAHARYVAIEKKRKEDAQKEAEFAKSLKKGMALHAHASHEAGAAELLEGLSQGPHFLDDFTVFDTETTGLSPEKDRILEIAAVRYTNWQEVGRMQEFVRFTGTVPHYITNLTGITSAHVRQAAESKVVLKQLRQLAGESLLVGHNVSFDLRMIEAERRRLGAVVPLPNRTLCTMQVAKGRTPAPHKLGVLCSRFGIPVVGAHRALNDVLMTFQLLQHLHQAEAVIPELAYASTASTANKSAAQPSLFAA